MSKVIIIPAHLSDKKSYKRARIAESKDKPWDFCICDACKLPYEHRSWASNNRGCIVDLDPEYKGDYEPGHRCPHGLNFCASPYCKPPLEKLKDLVECQGGDNWECESRVCKQCATQCETQGCGKWFCVECIDHHFCSFIDTTTH